MPITKKMTFGDYLSYLMNHFYHKKHKMILQEMLNGTMNRQTFEEQDASHEAEKTAIQKQLNKIKALAESRKDQELLDILNEELEVEVS